MEKQQTAVEWYDNEVNQLVSMLITNQLSISRYNNLKQKVLNQAKQMEKEQTLDAFDKGLITENVYYGYDDKKAEQYYESKYGKDEI